MKKVPIGKLVDKCATRLQLLVRMKAADDKGYAKCWSCGAVKHFKEMDGGHFIPRGKSFHKLREENIHPQCKGCNGFGMKHGNAEKEYTLSMIDYYGRDYVDWMIATKDEKVKWNRPELEDMLKELNEQIKEQQDRLGE